jgi:heat shock protein HtpX
MLLFVLPLPVLLAFLMASRFALWLHDARPLPARERRLRAMMQSLAKKAGVAAPRLYVIPEKAPNALVAMGAGRAVVAVTEGLLRNGSAQEMEAVLGRCLARMREEPARLRMQSTVAVLRGFLNSVLRFATFGMLGHEHGLGSRPVETAPLFVMPLAA